MVLADAAYTAFLTGLAGQAQSFMSVQNVTESLIFGGGAVVGIVRALRARGRHHEEPHPRIAALAEKAASQPPSEALVTVVEGLGSYIADIRRENAEREARLQVRVADLERDVQQLRVERDEWSGREAGYQAKIIELEGRVSELEAQHVLDVATIARLRTELDAMRTSLARAGQEAPHVG